MPTVRYLKRTISLLALFVSLCWLTGCSASTGDLFGKVTFNGNPVTAGTVQAFLPDGSTKTADISPDGSYRLTALRAGPVKLGVSNPNEQIGRSSKGKTVEAPSAGAGKAQLRLPDELASPEKSGLVARVKLGETQHDLALTGVYNRR